MSDDADITGDRIDTMRAAEVSQIQARGPDVAPMGYCLNCGPDVRLPAGRRWCDENCRDDWQKRVGR